MIQLSATHSLGIAFKTIYSKKNTEISQSNVKICPLHVATPYKLGLWRQQGEPNFRRRHISLAAAL